MKGRLTILLPLFACAAFAEAPASVRLPEPPPNEGREFHVVHFTCDFSDDFELVQNEPFDVFGLSVGLGVDFVPGRMAGLQWGSLVADAASAWGVQGSFGFAHAEASAGFQVALFSAGSDNHAGVQFGLLSARSGRLIGPQVGLFAAESERLIGIQFGGLEARAERLDGISVGLLVDSVRAGHGLAASLGTTWTARYRDDLFSGLQLAGIANFSQDVCGVQIALGANHARDCRGLQVSLCYNRAQELHGVQIGFVNKALSGSGVQIGFINLFGDDDDLLMLPFLNARF